MATNVLVKIGAALTSGFQQAFQSADQRLRSLGQAANSMNSQLATMRGFQQLEQQTRQLATQWQTARAQARTLRAELATMQSTVQSQSAALGTANAAVTRSGDTYRAAKLRLEQLTAEIRATRNPTQQQVAALQAAQAAASSTKEAWRQAKEQAKALGAELKQSQTAAREQARALQAAETEAGRAQQQFQRNREEMRRMREEMRQAGVDTRNLAAEQQRLEQQLARTERQQQRLANLRQAQGQNAQQRGELRGQVFDAVAAGAVVAAPIRAAVQFEDAMLGIAKQVEGARDSNGQLTSVYYDMRRQIQALGQELPMTTAEIAAMVTAGSRMSVPRDKIIEFTRLTAQMATAFEGVPAEIADSMGKIANNFRIPITNIRDLADTINYLDDNAIAKGGDIIDFLNRVSGTASQVKITEKEVAALGSTLLSLGETRETAATAINAIFSNLGAANNLSKPSKEMVASLGMSTAEIEKGMQTNVIGTIDKVIAAIGRLPKVAKEGQVSQIDAVAQLFGKENWDTFSKLINSNDELKRQLTMATGDVKYAEQINDAAIKTDALSKATGAAGSMQREFDARMQTSKAQIETLGNSFNVLSVNLGSVLLPTLNEVMAPIAGAAMALGRFADENPVATKAIMGTVAALAALRIATLVGGYGMAVMRGAVLAARIGFMQKTAAIMATNAALGTMLRTGVASAIAGIRNIIPATTAAAGSLVAMGRAAAVGALGGLRALGVALAGAIMSPLATMRAGLMATVGALRAMTIAALSNPLVAVAAAIAVAGYQIYKHWGEVKAFFSGFANGLSEAFTPITPLLSGVKMAVGSAVDWLSDFFAPVNASSEQLKSAANSGREFGRAIGGAFAWTAQTAGSVAAAFIGIADKAVGAFQAAIGSVAGFWEWLKTSTAAGFSSIADTVKSKWNEITGWLQSVNMTDIGAQLMDGLINGITSKISGVKDAVVGGVSGAYQGAKDFLGIKSPSRLMMQVGGYVSEGLAVGINQRAATAVAAAGLLAAGVATAATPELTIPAQNVAGAGVQQVKPQAITPPATQALAMPAPSVTLNQAAPSVTVMPASAQMPSVTLPVQTMPAPNVVMPPAQTPNVTLPQQTVPAPNITLNPTAPMPNMPAPIVSVAPRTVITPNVMQSPAPMPAVSVAPAPMPAITAMAATPAVNVETPAQEKAEQPQVVTPPPAVVRAVQAATPAQPATQQAAAPNVTHTSNPVYHITVSGAEGKPDDIARAIRQELDARERKSAAQQRASMYDLPAY